MNRIEAEVCRILQEGIRNGNKTITEGETITYEDYRYSIIIENARQIHFDESRIDSNLPEARLKAFNTCRNWQFANWIMAENKGSKSAP